MLQEIKISNFRSIKDEVVFSLKADKSKLKTDNIFEKKIMGSDNNKLLKAAALFGFNAVGKSNILKAVSNLQSYISNPPDVDKPNKFYDPFLLSDVHSTLASKICIEFTIKNVKYIYEISYNEHIVEEEKLIYFPEGRASVLLERKMEFDEDYPFSDKVRYKKGKSFSSIEVFDNQPALSRFGKDIPNELITPIYKYLTNEIKIINASDSGNMQIQEKKVNEFLHKEVYLKNRIAALISNSDFMISDLEIAKLDKSKLEEIDDLPDKVKQKIIADFKYQSYGKHSYKDNANNIKDVFIPMEEQSHGTRNTYILGTLIHQALSQGNAIFIDELDSSLHTSMVSTLVELFRSPITNPKGAQLVFTTHDTNILNQHVMRKDQIWFVEKGTGGVTDLYSLQDFSDVREDTPFEKWYLAGKFGALPNIPSVEQIYRDEPAN